MTKYLALATGAAIVIAATLSHAQTTPPGTDRPSGEAGEASSAKQNPDKKSKTDKSAPKTGSKQTPPGTDRQSGAPGETTSAKPKPGK